MNAGRYAEAQQQFHAFRKVPERQAFAYYKGLAYTQVELGLRDEAVRSAALSALAVAMEDELAALPRGLSPADFARASLRAIGIGYLQFAQTETGLFRTAFAVPEELRGVAAPGGAGNSGLNPFQLLGTALDRLVKAGVLPAARRPGAEYLAWSAVHGLAMLVIDGPLRRFTDAEMQGIEQRVLDMVEKGL